MSDFSKKFLLDDARRLNPNGRFAALAAFGKHPGWDDHVEDLGLETESLNLAKTVFYVSGIGGQIDAGAWEKLEPAQQFPGFKHVFVWQRTGQVLVGRLWSSSDGKGRKRYPLVVCAHFTGVTLGWALKQALPVLAELEEGCRAATTAEEVRSLLARKRAALREAIALTDGGGEYAALSPEQLNRILKSGGAARTEGFLRVLYQMQSQLAGFAPGETGTRGGAAGPRAQQVRVPVTAETPEAALLFWTRFFQTHVDAGVPLLLTLPLGEGWLDVTAGEPESHEFFCLRATPKAVPLVSEVPYNLDEAFRTRAASFLDAFERGETKAADLSPATSPATAAPLPAGGGKLKWLALGAVAVVIIVLAAVFLTRGDKSPGANESGSGSPATNVTPPPKAESPQAARPPAKSPQEIADEQARAAAKKKADDELAAAAKMRADAEAQTRERQAEEAARQQLLKEHEEKRLAAEAEAAAKKKAEDEAAAARKTNAPVVVAAATAPLTAVRPGQVEFTNSLGMVLVRITDRLWAGKYEVTQAEFRQVIGSGDQTAGGDRLPVVKVSWLAATNFCGQLTQREQARLKPGQYYSLPTEKQWLELAGKQKLEEIQGGVVVAGATGPAAVGAAGSPNEFGLCDVLGNVSEWCLDDLPGEQKLTRGGSFKSATQTRPARLDQQLNSLGFRCVLVSP